MPSPYATLDDAPKFEKRAGDVRAPWFKDPPAAKNLRVKDPLPYITSNAKTAPYATFQNVPKATEQSAPLPEQQPRPTTNGSQSPQQKKFSTPYGTSNDVVRPRSKLNLAKVHQPPWDRSDRKLDRNPVQTLGREGLKEFRERARHVLYLTFIAHMPRISKEIPNLMPNVAKVHPAPWERNDVHHKMIKVQPKFPHGEVASSTAPFAMDFKQG